jgi:hypothetical protein
MKFKLNERPFESRLNVGFSSWQLTGATTMVMINVRKIQLKGLFQMDNINISVLLNVDNINIVGLIVCIQLRSARKKYF